jgi:hypothetical protein
MYPSSFIQINPQLSWCLYIDALVVNDDGNITDACMTAVTAALKTGSSSEAHSNMHVTASSRFSETSPAIGGLRGVYSNSTRGAQERHSSCAWRVATVCLVRSFERVR